MPNITIYRMYSPKYGIFSYLKGGYVTLAGLSHEWCMVGASKIDRASYELLEASSDSYVNLLQRAFEAGQIQYWKSSF